MEEKGKSTQASRRDFLKKAAYVAPAVLTLTATPAFAKGGSPICIKGDHGDKIAKFKEMLQQKSGGPFSGNRQYSGLKTASNRGGRFGRYRFGQNR